jgi:hypothetical protein
MSEFIYVPSRQIRSQIETLTTTIKVKTNQIKIAQKQIAINETLITQYKEQNDVLKKKIEIAEKVGDKKLVRELQLELRDLRIKTQESEIIIENSNKRIPVLEKEIKELNEVLSDLNKNLEESLRYEEALEIRKTKTVVSLTDVSIFFGGFGGQDNGPKPRPIFQTDSLVTLNIKQGQKLETIISRETNQTFIKVSTISNFKNVEFTFKTVDYNNILISDDPHGGIIGPKTPNVIGIPENDLVFTLDNSYGFSNGVETTYVSQVLDYDMTLSISPSIGFITLDVDRKDGDLSLWVMTSSGNE